MTAYETFDQLHRGPEPLLIANAWNVKSAQLIETHGYPAIATSSGAIAHSLGYEDGEKIPFEELLYIIRRIRASTSLPLSVDVETGYTNDLGQLNRHIQQLLELGVAGINIEDAQGEDIFLRKLDSIRNDLDKRRQNLFINARIDCFRLKLPSPLDTAIRRAKLYEQTGANGLFVTAVSDLPTIAALARATPLPLNVVGSPQLSCVAALSQCGVRRISMAVFLFQAAYRKVGEVLHDIKKQQSFAPLY